MIFLNCLANWSSVCCVDVTCEFWICDCALNLIINELHLLQSSHLTNVYVVFDMYCTVICNLSTKIRFNGYTEFAAVLLYLSVLCT